MTTDVGKASANLDLSGVRQAFADDNKSAITISAGKVTFDSNTFICNSTYFSVTAEGDITATSGMIGDWTIAKSALYNGPSSSSELVTGMYFGDSTLYSVYYGSSSFYRTLTIYMGVLTLNNGTNTITMQDNGISLEALTGSTRCSVQYNLIALTDSSDNVWFNARTSQHSFMVNGSEVTGSDESMKKNMIFIEDAIPVTESRNYEKIIETLSPIFFEYKFQTDGKQHIGFTYQNACEALKAGGIDPDESAMVQTYEDSSTGEEIGGIEYNDIVALLVYEVQKLKQQIETLSA